MVKLFIAVVNMSVGASFCILAVMLLRLVLRRAPKIFSYLLWLVVLVRLVCPVLPEAKIGLVPDTELVEEIVDAPKEIRYLGYITKVTGKSNLPVGNGQEDGVKEGATSFPDEAIRLKGAMFRLQERELTVLASIWGLVAFGLLAYAVVGYVLFMRSINKKEVTTPFVAGLLRPVIYLPDGLDDMQRQLVQEHEKIHIRRLDYLIKPGAFLVCCVHWFNPLVWVAFFLMEKDMEASCDEAVIRKIGYDRRKDYANTLLGLSQSRGWRAGYPIAFGENYVKKRIKGVVKMKKVGIGVVTLAVVVVLAAAGLLLVDQPEKEASELTDALAVSEPVDVQEEGTDPSDEMAADPASEPEPEAEDDIVNTPPVQLHEYYGKKELAEDGDWSYIASSGGSQETIMNYDPGRDRDQYDVLYLPQQDEAFDDFGILFSYPVEGARISDGFGIRTNPVSGDMLYHMGIDFAAEEGSVIMAAADGTVVETGFDAECGNYVILLHENGNATYYFHCREITAEEGGHVSRGEQIATVGKTGRATGSFVHFAVSENGKYIEPEFVEE